MASQKREQAPALQSLKSGPPRKPIRDTNSVPPDRVGAGTRRPLQRKEKGGHDVSCPYTGLNLQHMTLRRLSLFFAFS